MRNGEIKSVERVTSSIAGSVRDATYRSAAARRFTSKAQDALEDGMYETKRALKLFKRRVETLEHSARHYVKGEPLKSVAAIAGVAFLVGLIVGLKKRRKPRRIFGAVV